MSSSIVESPNAKHEHIINTVARAHDIADESERQHGTGRFRDPFILRSYTPLFQ